MNKLFTIILFFSLSTILFSQNILGTWSGEINAHNNKLAFSFHISETNNEYSTTIDIPLQNVKDYKAEKTTFKNSKLSISIPGLKINYEGNLLEKDEIHGNMVISDHTIPLNLKKGIIKINRPQEPKPPFNYYSEEITFNTPDNIKLKGTLTLPQKNGKFPIVIIISGSGPQNRDGEMFGHKPYLVLSDYLTKKGIGVFRFDERGVGKSEGNYKTATIETFSSDVEAAIRYLQEKKQNNILKLGLIGHSLGGIIAPEIASKNNNIAFVILMAAPGLDGDKLMLSQKATYERRLGIDETEINKSQKLIKGAYDIIINSNLNNQQLKDSINSYFMNNYGTLLPQKQREMMVEQIISSEFIGIIRSKPTNYLKQLKCPVLAINGTKDFQIPSKENLESIGNSIKENGNKKVQIVELENFNHLFQESTTGLLDEYAQIEQTISPIVLELISNWITEQIK